MGHVKVRPVAPKRHRGGMEPLTGRLLCDHPQCRRPGFDCYLPDGAGRPYAIYCATHAERNGFCKGCGQFWGGIESFEFGPHAGLCDECADQLEDELADDQSWDGYDWSWDVP